MFIPIASRFDADSLAYFDDDCFSHKMIKEVLLEITSAYNDVRFDVGFWSEVNHYWHEYAGRPSPLYFAKGLSDELGAKIYLKREDLNHTGSYKINNAIAQALLAKRLGKNKIIAKTDTGENGVASATAAALLGLECEVFMETKDIARQKLSLFQMKLLGAKVHSVEKKALKEAICRYAGNVRDTFYIIGSNTDPYPYPLMVRDFQSVISFETREQILEKEEKLPDYVIACIDGESGASGIFARFIDEGVECVGVRASGRVYTQLDSDYEYMFEDSAIRRELVEESKALEAFTWLSQKEGIVPSFESACAVAYLKEIDKRIQDKIVVISLNSGDRDMMQAKNLLQFH